VNYYTFDAESILSISHMVILSNSAEIFETGNIFEVSNIERFLY
jgi:hypothetical protein